jgi:hypothetical protein
LQSEDFAGRDRAVDVERDLAGRSRERLERPNIPKVDEVNPIVSPTKDVKSMNSGQLPFDCIFWHLSSRNVM